MAIRHLTYQECPKHNYLHINSICGCPRTNRTNGLYVYKSEITGNWVVWDIEGWTWLSLSGSWKTSIETANLYLQYRRDNPGRNWGILVNSDS